MKNQKLKSQIVLFIILVLLGFGFMILSKKTLNDTKEQEISIQKEEIKIQSFTDDEIPFLVIKGEYPATGVGSENIKAKIYEIIHIFKNENLEYFNSAQQDLFSPTEEYPYTLQINYENNYGKDTITHQLEFYSFTGGAHGITVMETYTFDLKRKELIELEDVFINVPAGLERVSNYVRNYLLNNPDYKDYLDVSWLEEGTDPKNSDNYKAFILNEDSITFIFQHYQIGPYTLGIVKVDVPFEELKAILSSRF